MNYEANEIRWPIGAIVIHDADAKEPKMLMQVIGYSRDGLCKTQYVSKTQRRTIWKNGLEFLHDPERFGIKAVWGTYRQDLLENVQRHWMRVKNWNRRFPEDCPVIAWDGAGDKPPTKVRGKAYMDASGAGFIWVEGLGNWCLDFLVPNVEENQAIKA